jgi:hypothetical protein
VRRRHHGKSLASNALYTVLEPMPMSASGHVWTAPWQVLSNVSAALVGCGHVSGLLMRQVWPLALMLCADRVPIVFMHLKVR